MDIIIASKNLHKIREFRVLIQTLSGIDALSLLDFPEYQPAEETGDSFEEIAAQKAVHAAKALGKYVFADDSGIVVPALNDRPGIYSRRFAGEDATDSENRQKLMDELEGKKDLDRSAYFVCSIAVASPEGLLKTVTGRCEGVIADKEKGRSGFGYDAIFVKHDYDKTFAELDDAVKNRISHRSKAFEKISAFIEQLAKEELAAQ